jgi:hypothetical protein
MAKKGAKSSGVSGSFKGGAMSKKSVGSGKLALSQALGSGVMKGVSGMNLGSKLEGHAGVPYKGYSAFDLKHGKNAFASATTKSSHADEPDHRGGKK